MRRLILILFALTLTALAQTGPMRVHPDEAVKHALKQPAPPYPPIAQSAHIQGNVILQVQVDETGAVTVVRAVRGHPLLTPAAIDTVKRWTYHPFEADGKPVSAATFVMVTFGNPANHNAEDRAEILFQHDFRNELDAGRRALEGRDLPTAETKLKKAAQLLGPNPKARFHTREAWELSMSTGHLRFAQEKYEEAETSYKDALALQREYNKDGSETAASLLSLGNLYSKQQRSDLARQSFERSLAIYRKNYKETPEGTGVRQIFGTVIAYEAGVLAKQAALNNDKTEAAKHCRTLEEFDQYVTTDDRNSLVSVCATTN